jgi:glycine/D-amino acid oxidase-like deaminating enzyme
VEIVVVGGGVVGASVAYRVAQAGAAVTLLDAGRLAGGTSAATFAWINSNDKTPLEYHRLNAAGMVEHTRLRQEFGTAPWLHVDGNVEWGGDSPANAALRRKVERLQGWGYDAELLPVGALRDIEPELLPEDGVTEFAFYPREGYVDVPVLVGALARAAETLGAKVRPGCRVAGFAVERGHVRGVVTARGEHIDADLVVNCAGRWAGHVAALGGVDVPLAPTCGLLAISFPSPVALRSIMHSHAVNLRPDGAGRIMMRAGEFDATVREDTPLVPLPAACHRILERARRVLPGLAGTALEAARVGVRPIPSDGLPLVGPLPGAAGAYIVCTHSGVTLGPLLGRLVADEVVRGFVDPRLRPFRPERLVS